MLSEPDAPALVRAEDQIKHNALFWACKNLPDHMTIEIVPKILDKGADPYKLDIYAEDVLYYLAKEGTICIM